MSNCRYRGVKYFSWVSEHAVGKGGGSFKIEILTVYWLQIDELAAYKYLLYTYRQVQSLSMVSLVAVMPLKVHRLTN